LAQDSAGSDSRRALNLLLVVGLFASSGPFGLSQTSSDQPSATPPAATQQAPAYEVATIKPPGPNDYVMPLRQYIQIAFGLDGLATGLVFGPGWINSATYVIHGKPPDSIRDAMKTMAPAERYKEEQLMMQALLADRFKLKAHFETRVMPLYELTVTKGGPKLKENPDTGKGMASVGASRIRGTDVPLRQLVGFLETVPDIGGRVIVDKTGLTGTYDFNLKWTPLDAGAPGGIASSPNAESVSLFSAIEEQLGLKLTSTKGPGQVLIIDHIEQPSEN
jgi:uncharacterized protein (TIGR03435 family)